ncbi:MAG: hypothetical protein HYS04_08645 [Acidobacteria bacterium]|nr:hypothetical protein [Acidobacteriota bacterium]
MPRGAKPAMDPIVLEAALEGLQLQRKRIDQQIDHVRSLLGKGRRGRPRKTETNTAGGSARRGRRRRRLSAEARKRIAAGQKRRWANYRKAAAAAE